MNELGKAFAGGAVRTGDKASIFFVAPLNSATSTHRWTPEPRLTITLVPESATLEG